MSDAVKITGIVVSGVVLVALLMAVESLGTTRAYINAGFCQTTTRRELPPVEWGKPNWTWDTTWQKCGIVPAEAKP